MASIKPVFDRFREIAKEKELDLNMATVNGQFIKFTSPQTDNMWLGFCMAEGVYDVALSRSSQEAIDHFLQKKAS